MSDIADLKLAELRDGLKAKDFSAKEATQSYLTRMDAAQALNAYITPTPDKALAMAATSDEKLAKGEGGDLEGVPLGIKDLFCTEDTLTTAASHILDGFTPKYESTV
ncbi:MAG: amidase family protein, partial [Aquisalinus sp.]|nr:amidase family protein [Aquisalinus sp.]